MDQARQPSRVRAPARAVRAVRRGATPDGRRTFARWSSTGSSRSGAFTSAPARSARRAQLSGRSCDTCSERGPSATTSASRSTARGPTASRRSRRAISAADVERTLAVGRPSFDRGSAGLRDAVLLVVYGLRAREVAALTLDDFDWRASVLHVRGRKAGHAGAYPLAPEVGEAVLEYLRQGRPETTDRRIFFHITAPRAAITYRGVSFVQRSTCARQASRCRGPGPTRYGTVRPAARQRGVLPQGDRRLPRPPARGVNEDLQQGRDRGVA